MALAQMHKYFSIESLESMYILHLTKNSVVSRLVHSQSTNQKQQTVECSLKQ